MDESDFTTQEGDDRPMFTSRRHRRRAPERMARGIIVATVILAAGVGGWLWHRSRARRADRALESFPAAAPPASAPLATPTPVDQNLPPLDASDAMVRSLVAGLSSRPQLASWLTPDALVHRFVLAVVDVSIGRSPGAPLAVLSPERPFSAQTSDDRLVVDPASYHRYDAMAATFASVDAQGTARLYTRVRPLVEEAYKELGLRGQTFQETLARAFGRLLAVDFPDTPPELVRPGVTYLYADPKLEELSAAQKDLLRVGPENGRLIQAKLRELAAAMGVQPVAPPAGG